MINELLKLNKITKEDELFDYADIRDFLKTNNKSSNEKEKNDFEISL